LADQQLNSPPVALSSRASLSPSNGLAAALPLVEPRARVVALAEQQPCAGPARRPTPPFATRRRPALTVAEQQPRDRVVILAKQQDIRGDINGGS
jgi:hypothetical protein